jgi:hypothetical protein
MQSLTQLSAPNLSQEELEDFPEEDDELGWSIFASTVN